MKEKKGKTDAGRLELRRMRLEDIHPYRNNPRIIDKAVPLVAESMRQVGYITLIVVDEAGEILAGHTRYEALKENGAEDCEVVVVSGATDEQKRKYRILDNKTGELAAWDREKLVQELEGVNFNGFDFGQPVDTSVFNDEVDDGSVSGQMRQRVVICPRCKSEVPA